MSTTTTGAAAITQTGFETRVLAEGYGPGAWHGADMKAALADVAPALAFWRPGEGRHNIAEIAVHHAFYAHSVRGRVAGKDVGAFALPGEDWFDLADESTLSWLQIRSIVESAHQRLDDTIAEIESGKLRSPLDDAERFSVILGITCHAVYHAGQIQLIKRLSA